jgi:hypothetical protein
MLEGKKIISALWKHKEGKICELGFGMNMEYESHTSS